MLLHLKHHAMLDSKDVENFVRDSKVRSHTDEPLSVSLIKTLV